MRSLQCFAVGLILSLGLSVTAVAASDQTTPAAPTASAASMTATVDRIFYREAQMVQNMRQYRPMVETYIQNTQPDKELGAVPTSDKYFLGRMDLKNGIENVSYDRKRAGVFGRVVDRMNTFYKMNYVPTGFMQLVFLNAGFTKQNYDLKFLRREFLCEVRCLVFDAVPKPKLKGPHFIGRIWVEDQDDTIVRFNGTYEPQSRTNFYFHFDSWRLNVQPRVWLPAYVYTEESNAKYDLFRHLMMRGQTRLWGYDLKHSGRQEEFTNVLVDAPNDEVADHTDSAPNEVVPLKSEHMWQREAEDNVLDRMERAGVLAPAGEVDKVLQTVVNNLEITNKLDIQPEVRCRVLVTTPLESFTVGHTIVVSRGLLDVLPDEASLAMVLAHELAHIALGHNIDTKYAFSDRMIFPDEETFRRIELARDPALEAEADKKGLDFLKNSPYRDKLGNAGLFLRALDTHSKQLSALISPHFGARITSGNAIRMAALMPSAPQLKTTDVSQIAALPLGSRVKMDPWDDHLNLQKSKPVPLITARDKMAFEVTPVFPNLARYRASQELASSQSK
jgi:hypothetical protein